MWSAINIAIRSVSKLWMILWIAIGISVYIPVARACSWSYVIWGIRSKPADPLFRFVRNGRAGYIDSQGKIVIQPLLPGGNNFFGEFHEGLVAIKDDHGYRYLDSSGRVVFRTNAWLAGDSGEGEH